MNTSSIYLDTSIQFDRILGDFETRSRVTEKLNGNSVLSSTYVLMEWRRTILKDLCFVIALLHDYDIRDNARQSLADATTSWTNVDATFTEMSRKRADKAVEIVLNSIDPEENIILVGDLIDRIRFWINELETEFHFIKDTSGVDQQITLINDTDCDLAEGPFERNPRKMMCIHTLAQCNLPLFLKERNSVLNDLDNKLKTTPQTRMQKYLNERLRHKSNPELAKGQESCWFLAEAIKFAEIPSSATLYTSDKLLESIADLLGMPLFS